MTLKSSSCHLVPHSFLRVKIIRWDRNEHGRVLRRDVKKLIFLPSQLAWLKKQNKTKSKNTNHKKATSKALCCILRCTQRTVPQTQGILTPALICISRLPFLCSLQNPAKKWNLEPWFSKIGSVCVKIDPKPKPTFIQARKINPWSKT